MKKLLLIFAIFIAVFWIQSCEQQAVDPDTAVTSVTLERDLSPLKDIGAFTESEADAIKTILAKSLAKAVANPDIRAFLKQEVMKEFDGDFDILFNAVKDSKIGELTLAQHLIVNLPVLEDNVPNNKALRRAERFDYEAVKAFVKNLDFDTDKMPLLQFAVPFYGEDWDSKEIIPVVAVTEDVIGNYTSGLNMTAYYEDGKTVTLKSNELPDFPVMVVSENERLVVVRNTGETTNGRLASCPIEPQFKDVNYSYYAGDEYLSNCGSPISSPPPAPPKPAPAPTSCARDKKGTNAYEQMRNIKFLSMDKLREAEGWFSGRIELRAIVLDYLTAQSGDYAFSMLFYERREKFKTCGILPGSCRTDNYDPKRDILIWDQAAIGDRMMVRFYEDNKSADSEIEIEIPFQVKIKILGKETTVGPKIKAKIKLKNKLLGDNYVYYCNAVSKQYNNNWLTFQIRPEGL